MDIAARIAAGNIRIASVYGGSALLAIAVAAWAKHTSHPEFDMCHSIDMALAAVDFGGDALFVIEALEKGALALAGIAGFLLGLSSVISFCVCTWMVYYHFRADMQKRKLQQGKSDGDLIHWDRAGKNASLYATIIILSATNSELVKLYPWKENKFDGFPRSRLAIRVTQLALLEDLPQLIFQLIYMITVEASPVAVASFAVTVIDLLWRVIKRGLRLMAAEVGNVTQNDREASRRSRTLTRTRTQLETQLETRKIHV